MNGSFLTSIGVDQEEQGIFRKQLSGFFQKRPDMFFYFPRLSPGTPAVGRGIHDDSVVFAAPSYWEFFDLPDEWSISYRLPCLPAQARPLTFRLKPFSFKHTGLFPEQAANWNWFTALIRDSHSFV